jgi:hypothetical protein
MYIVAVASGKNGPPFFGYCSGYSKGGFCLAFGASYINSFTHADIFYGHLNPQY